MSYFRARGRVDDREERLWQPAPDLAVAPIPNGDRDQPSRLEAIKMRQKGYYVLVFVAVAMLALGVTAWAKTYALQATSITPGATGSVDVKGDKTGGNTEMTIKVDHLARPTLLTPPANEYVVWIAPEDGAPQNQGVLQVGDNEKGDLKMTTSSSKFRVLVTAETEPHPKTPSNRVVLQSNVQE
jgi:hypothetical protein